MSMKNDENLLKSENLLAKQNDVAPAQCAAEAPTGALYVEAESTTSSEIRIDSTTTADPLIATSAVATTMAVDENDSASGNQFDIAPATSSAGGSTRSSSSGCGNRKDVLSEKRRSSGDKSSSKRKTRRGKTKRGKRPSGLRALKESPWKFQVPKLRSTTGKRRSEVTLGTIGGGVIPLIAPLRQLDHPLLVPYNTNRFLMEDHMPHVLTPSEDEEEFLTKEFSSVYEDARSERLEGLSKSQLIQEYLQLEANYEQVTRRYNTVKSLSIKEENENAASNATATTKDAPDGSSECRRLEDRIRDLTTENLELRRQLEHASRFNMILSAKSSPRNNANQLEQMDSSSGEGTSSEDSESDSSTSTSSSSTDDEADVADAAGSTSNRRGSSSSTMSDIDEHIAHSSAQQGGRHAFVRSLAPEERSQVQLNGIHEEDD
ncbi:protein HEXIM1 [Sabethes cyaneus]|uniref:protein HEXIM1 n=1 Tax=Sabethes cyaneus TaxID=53552 RepID=UPI00237D9063|nr:protein HEXIM1 [Sabethes cyaneus]XP_053682591.1 protein HEXIM1 [Sabethes cyaneus]XP_053682592.1 protein HEXIM1 [Sabethes cyaneus]XP_053682593.1 protein HEXIM1 [Sabethes cyaneus]XP_053682594.1 protein HEXIM1 [Sabethes cyaneus]